jgi:hypothetical protein
MFRTSSQARNCANASTRTWSRKPPDRSVDTQES